MPHFPCRASGFEAAAPAGYVVERECRRLDVEKRLHHVRDATKEVGALALRMSFAHVRYQGARCASKKARCCASGRGATPGAPATSSPIASHSIPT